MKRYMMTMMMAMTAWMGANAMDYETARNEAYYLTDKMAYELNLNEQQYNDAFEINLDYLLSVESEADLMDARYLNYRNEDLHNILHAWQWTAFVASHYLFRPLLWRSGAWYLPVYDYYARTHFYYHRPSIFWEYRGGHGRYYFTHGYYASRRPAWNGGLRGHHHTMIGRPHNNHSIVHRGGSGHNSHNYGRPDMGHRPNDFGHNHSATGFMRDLAVIDEETGIDECVSSPSVNDKYVDMLGRTLDRVSRRGIYLQNGKKIVVY